MAKVVWFLESKAHERKSSSHEERHITVLNPYYTGRAIIQVLLCCMLRTRAHT
jgi:hypothetical protein